MTRLIGGAGSDTIEGGAGADEMDGGTSTVSDWSYLIHILMKY